MAHLQQKQISDNSCKAIIIDTILESVRPLTQSELSSEITSIFHILISSERLNLLTTELCSDGVIYYDDEEHIKLNPIKEVEFVNARTQENKLCQEATSLWITRIGSITEITPVLEKALSQALPIFLRSLFVKHGVSSYELLTAVNVDTQCDLKDIASSVSKQFEYSIQNDIESLLPTVFHSLDQPRVVEYLTHSIDKAVGYISEVISDENLVQVKSALKNLTIYLDTNTIYRLLNLQGQSRYESIRDTLNFCIKNGIKIRVSAQTQKELSARLKYDSKVLIKFPTSTNLAQAGYKYRTSDNYISTYWQQARTTHVSVEDFISYYQNYDVILAADHIILEEIEVDEEALVERARYLYEKMSVRDPYHEKSDSGLWHDAYNLAYVQKMQRPDAKTSVETGCLFLTADQALTAIQREDNELKELPPIVITPSQLLQLFSFTTPGLGYEETFIKFFASSSLGRTFEYCNDDIQEILSRINHYKGMNPAIAEKILARALLNGRYLAATTDEEREEIIYNSISEELLTELNLTQAEVSALTTEKTQLADDHKAAVAIIEKNKELFAEEKKRLQAEANKANHQLQQEANARRLAEADAKKANQYSAAQEKLYVDEKWNKWKRRHLWMFWCAVAVSVLIVIGSIILWQHTNDSGCLGFLGALAIPALVLPYGGKVFSAGTKTDIQQKLLDDYRDKLREIK